MADFSCMTLRKDGERVDPVAIRVLPICPCSFDGKSAFCRILVRVQTGVACRRVRKRLGTAGPVGAESAHGVPYLKRQRTRLITGYILVRGQGEPPENEGRMLNLLFFPVSRNDRFQMEASGTSTTGPFASLPKDFSYPFWDFSMIQITFWTDESSVEDTTLI